MTAKHWNQNEIKINQQTYEKIENWEEKKDFWFWQHRKYGKISLMIIPAIGSDKKSL